jgi:carboxyl-terminal processing protease
MIKKIKLIKIWLTLFSVFILFSCNRTDDEYYQPNFEEGTTESVNLWVQDSMKRYYYWAEQMPKKPNYSLPTKDFFKSLLSSQDKFSSVLDKNNAETYAKTVRSLYGFDYSVLQQNGKTFAVIKLVMQNSPAQNVGLIRGKIITKINGTEINSGNMNQVESMMINSASPMQLTVGNWENGNITGGNEIMIYQSFTFDQPLVSKIFEQNGKKIGYLYIYNFQNGMASSFANKFAEFKSSGISELILDLRYNYGGMLASSAALCAMIPSGISGSSPFIIYRGNKNGGEVNLSFSQQIASDTSAPNFSTLFARNLGLNKLYVLTTENTASASETVINNLKPYLQVIQIGGKTMGKDMAGWDIDDKRTPPKISWQIHPMIYKLYNINNEGNYSSGLMPVISVNEFSNWPILELGNPEETLLKKALQEIN